jgi:hypothetical protein
MAKMMMGTINAHIPLESLTEEVYKAREPKQKVTLTALQDRRRVHFSLAVLTPN